LIKDSNDVIGGAFACYGRSLRWWGVGALKRILLVMLFWITGWRHFVEQVIGVQSRLGVMSQ